MNASNSALNAKLTKLNEEFEEFKKGKDQEIQHITTSIDFIHCKYKEMKIENEKLAAEVKRVESKLQDKVDELEQYSRRSCLIHRNTGASRGTERRHRQGNTRSVQR